jgi:hypothetical protein
MRVLAYEQRLEAARFERARQLADLDAIVGWKMEGADQHGNTPPTQCIVPARRGRSMRIIPG